MLDRCVPLPPRHSRSPQRSWKDTCFQSSCRYSEGSDGRLWLRLPSRFDILFCLSEKKGYRLEKWREGASPAPQHHCAPAHHLFMENKCLPWGHLDFLLMLLCVSRVLHRERTLCWMTLPLSSPSLNLCPALSPPGRQSGGRNLWTKSWVSDI